MMFFLSLCADFRDFHSFPTRRSSDLWLQGGRIKVGFLGGAQIDRYANLNTTVVGPYEKPKVRLPGGGGAPEIATSCGEILDRKSTRLNSSHLGISYAVFCLKKKQSVV